jgi:hypothetical protein
MTAKILLAALGIGLLFARWWFSAGRKAEVDRRERRRIHNEVAAHDVDAVRARLRRLRAER